MTKLKLTEDWRDKNPERVVRGDGKNQIAGVFAVNGSRYWCSLVELDSSIIEFMAFRWNSHLGKVTNWNGVFVKQMVVGKTPVTRKNATFPAMIDERTFKACMEAFEGYLQLLVEQSCY